MIAKSSVLGGRVVVKFEDSSRVLTCYQVLKVLLKSFVTCMRLKSQPLALLRCIVAKSSKFHRTSTASLGYLISASLEANLCALYSNSIPHSKG